MGMKYAGHLRGRLSKKGQEKLPWHQEGEEELIQRRLNEKSRQKGIFICYLARASNRPLPEDAVSICFFQHICHPVAEVIGQVKRILFKNKV